MPTKESPNIIVKRLIAKGISNAGIDRLYDVTAYVIRHLSAIPRRSGESYALHCAEVAAVFRESSDDASLLCVALLHDLLIHPQGEQLLRSSPLSPEEQELVQEMHRLRRLHISERTKDLDTVISAFSSDPRLLSLRMAHRLNDIRHLDRFEPSLANDIASETLHMYSAIAGRLGMSRWRYEMEDTCFPIIHPVTARSLSRKFATVRPLDDSCLTHTVRYLRRKLKDESISSACECRIKGYFSTYRKMILKHRRFNELTDRLAIRIIVPTVMDCYRTLAVVHAYMHPIPGKLKDYIGAPKENGYQSLHTVVYPLPGVTEQPIEIQIRTEEMHHRCEFGAASHGEYKNAMYALTTRPARVNLFRNLATLREEARSPKQFEAALRSYFREDHVAIFDGDNNLYHLKEPAAALDFVCIAFPKRWHRLKDIRINGRIASFATLLHDGDIVEARFARAMTVLPEWKDAVRHRSTKQKIKEALTLE